MSLNPDLIQDRFHDIQQSLERLEQMRALPREVFLSDQDTLDVACYRLLVAIEAALQICFHVSTRYPNGLPDSIPARVYTRGAAEETLRMADPVLQAVESKLGTG